MGDSSSPDPAMVTRMLGAVRDGEAGASDRLLDLIYGELRLLAQAKMRNEPAGHTLQATALVHEAYLRLLDDHGAGWENRRHFFGAAAQAMRRILIERYRRASGPQRGGGRDRVDLDALEIAAADGAGSSLDLVALDEALRELERQDPRMAQVVMLRFFAGLSVEDTAAALDCSPRTVKREWSVARAWLFQRLGGGS